MGRQRITVGTELDPPGSSPAFFLMVLVNVFHVVRICVVCLAEEHSELK